MNTPIGIRAACQFPYEEMSDKRVEIKILAPMALHRIKIGFDIGALRGGNGLFIRCMNGDWLTISRLEPRILKTGIGIDLEMITTCQCGFLIVFGCHWGDLYTSLMNLYLVAQLIVAFVFAIQYHIDKSAIGRIWHLHLLTDAKGQQVSHEGLVGIIID